ncbi:Cytoplasmic dynein 1 intermediate chain 2, partial [Neolecta irregularis DAH-3]
IVTHQKTRPPPIFLVVNSASSTSSYLIIIRLRIMERRRAEIEAKKAKLEALRKQREDRKLSLSRQEITSPQPLSSSRKDIDDLVASLVGNRTDSALESEIGSERGVISPPLIHPIVASTKNLEIGDVNILLDVAPKEETVQVIMYSKEIQTSNISDDEDTIKTTPINEDAIRERIRRELMEEKEEKPNEPVKQEEEIPKTPELSEKEKDTIISSNNFLDFLDRSTKVIERAMNEEYDILVDYGMVSEDKTQSDSHGQKLKESLSFYDSRWNKKRSITSLSFSPKESLFFLSSLILQFSELVLASYTKNPSAPSDPDGLVQIWNSHLPSRAEYTFHSQSDILTASFSPFHPNLVVGGAYSGQILLWDTRVKTNPVLKTPLGGGGHTHPVYGVMVVGTQNANNVISCSTDGVVCAWTVDMLAQPQELLELSTPPPTKTDEIAPTCLTFQTSDPTHFILGTEEGTLYPVHRYDRAGSKAGVDPNLSYRGHTAPVTSVDFHPVKGLIDLGDLVLSSSLDWTVRLWKTKMSTGVQGQQIVREEVEFAKEDMVYDVKWSPLRPGLWGCVDGAGGVELWDINVDLEVPVARVVNEGGRSLNKLAWEQHEGKKLAVGGLDGRVTLYDIDPEIAGQEFAKPEEWAVVRRLGRGRLESN